MDTITNSSYQSKNIKLVNLKAPVELLDRFEQTVEFILVNRTQVLLHLMEVFTKTYEDKMQQVHIIKSA